jgi:hypothetical protein
MGVGVCVWVLGRRCKRRADHSPIEVAGHLWFRSQVRHGDISRTGGLRWNGGLRARFGMDNCIEVSCRERLLIFAALEDGITESANGVDGGRIMITVAPRLNRGRRDPSFPSVCSGPSSMPHQMASPEPRARATQSVKTGKRQGIPAKGGD